MIWDSLEPLEHQDSLAHKDPQGSQENLEPPELLENKVYLDKMGVVEILEREDTKVPQEKPDFQV